MIKHFLFLFLLIFLPVVLLAQGFNSTNGRNHPELNWQQAETEHFKIMYPERIAGIEAEAAPIAEHSYEALSKNTEVTFDEKIRIYLSDEDEINNGFAVPIGNGYTDIWVHLNDYADVWTGEVKWLRKVIAHELAHIFHFKAVEGTIGGWQFLFGDPLPSFWTEGLAQYQTEKWDSQRGDRWLRRAVFDDALNYNNNSSIINGQLRYAVGNSQLRYFTETHGDSTLTDLLHHRKDFLWWNYHDFYDAFSEVADQSYEEFYDEWQKHVNIYYNTLAGQMGRTDSLSSEILKFPGQFVYDVVFSPDQSQYAVLSQVSMERPVRRLYLVQNDSTRQAKTLVEGTVNDDINWSPDGSRLTYSRRVRGAHSSLLNDLHLYDLDDLDRRYERRITHSRRARYPVFSTTGDSLAFVVNEGETANIYLRNLRTGLEHRLTSHQEDVQLLHLVWNHHRNELVFHRFEADGGRHLVIRDVESGGERIVDKDSVDNRMPVISPDGQQIAFTSLRDEVPNVFIYDLESSSTRRFTDQITGAEALDWLAPTDSVSYGRLVVKASERKDRDELHLVADTITVEEPEIEYLDAHSSWRGQAPPNEIPPRIEADESLIERQSSYNSWSNITHAFSFALPYYAGGNDFGLFGSTSWTEPLGKHTITGAGNISFRNPEVDSYGGLAYFNNQFYPTIALAGYKLPGSTRIYGSELFVDELIGGEISATWPVDRWSAPYRSDQFGLRLRHVLVRSLLDVRISGDTIFSEAAGLRQTDLQLSWTTKKQCPYRHNTLHPIDGYGVRMQLTGSEKILGSETAFLTHDISVYKIFPSVSLHRFYVYGRFQMQFGESLPQNYIGFSEYDNIDIPLPGGYPFTSLTEVERVRGYQSFVTGKQVLFGSLEYRIPFLPSLGTSLLGLVELGRTGIALFTDAGIVGDVQFPEGQSTDRRWGAGTELKNMLRLGPLQFVHSVGIGQPYDKLFSGDTYDLYYRIKASVPF